MNEWAAYLEDGHAQALPLCRQGVGGHQAALSGCIHCRRWVANCRSEWGAGINGSDRCGLLP